MAARTQREVRRRLLSWRSGVHHECVLSAPDLPARRRRAARGGVVRLRAVGRRRLADESKADDARLPRGVRGRRRPAEPGCRSSLPRPQRRALPGPRPPGPQPGQRTEARDRPARAGGVRHDPGRRRARTVGVQRRTVGTDRPGSEQRRPLALQPGNRRRDHRPVPGGARPHGGRRGRGSAGHGHDMAARPPPGVLPERRLHPLPVAMAGTADPAPARPPD